MNIRAAADETKRLVAIARRRYYIARGILSDMTQNVQQVSALVTVSVASAALCLRRTWNRRSHRRGNATSDRKALAGLLCSGPTPMGGQCGVVSWPGCEEIGRRAQRPDATKPDRYPAEPRKETADCTEAHGL